MIDIEKIITDTEIVVNSITSDTEIETSTVTNAVIKKGFSPYIQDGYWYEYNNTSKTFVNTGIKAKGSDGYTPVKGIDYFDGKNGKDGKDGVDGKVTEEELERVAEEVIGRIEVPTKTSQLDNDSDYITSAYHDNTKQDVINDLSGIRNGASLGATALQSVPNEYAKKSDIPDTSNFITKAVNDLTNYYVKSDTYTQTEVNNLIGKIKSISIEKVDLLPVSGDENKIYLVPSAATQEKNIYDEYLYFNNSWELIGNTKIDLSNYYTKTESDSKFLTLDTLPRYNGEVE